MWHSFEEQGKDRRKTGNDLWQGPLNLIWTIQLCVLKSPKEMCQTALHSLCTQMGHKPVLSSSYASLSLQYAVGMARLKNKANLQKYIHSLMLYISCNFGFSLGWGPQASIFVIQIPKAGSMGLLPHCHVYQAIPPGQPQTLVGRLAYRSSELMMNGCEVFVIAQAPL